LFWFDFANGPNDPDTRQGAKTMATAITDYKAIVARMIKVTMVEQIRNRGEFQEGMTRIAELVFVSARDMLTLIQVAPEETNRMLARLDSIVRSDSPCYLREIAGNRLVDQFMAKVK